MLHSRIPGITNPEAPKPGPSSSSRVCHLAVAAPTPVNLTTGSMSLEMVLVWKLQLETRGSGVLLAPLHTGIGSAMRGAPEQGVVEATWVQASISRGQGLWKESCSLHTEDRERRGLQSSSSQPFMKKFLSGSSGKAWETVFPIVVAPMTWEHPVFHAHTKS